MVAKSKKIAYFAHLEECLNKYARAAISVSPRLPDLAHRIGAVRIP